MWIITSNKIVNADRFESIEKVGKTTFAVIKGETRVIAFDDSAYDKIVEAIKNKDDYVEVD